MLVSTVTTSVRKKPGSKEIGAGVLVLLGLVFWCSLDVDYEQSHPIAKSTRHLPNNVKIRKAPWEYALNPKNNAFLDERYDVCCVGAGLSGGVIAERYANLLDKKVLVIDKRDHIGGNCYDYVDDDTGILVNLYGAHLFHTNYERVWEYVQKFSNWTKYEHRVMAYVNDKHVPVPVNIDTVNQLFKTNIEKPEEMAFWLKKETGDKDPNNNYADTSTGGPKNSEEMAISRVGRRLFNLIFKPYTKKQWDKEAAELGPEVTARIPVRSNYDDRYFGDKYQALPSRGYTKFFESLILNNPKITVHTNVDYFKVKPQLKCDRLYFSGPIDAYYAHLGWPKLEYRSLDFQRGVQKNKDYMLPLSVVNYPSRDYSHTRIVEYKHYLNQSSPHTIFFFEHSKDGGEPYYPVPNKENKDLFLKYQDMAQKEEGVTFVGRLANYKYFNMDQSIQNALELFDKDTGYEYKPESEPWVVKKHDYTLPGPENRFLSDRPKPSRRVLISGIHFAKLTGGPEALLQLGLAFREFLPKDMLYWYFPGQKSGLHPSRFHGGFLKQYDGVPGQIPFIGSHWNLGEGDILILPEIERCPTFLVNRGVSVYRFLLRPDDDYDFGGEVAAEEGCRVIAHNFWLGSNIFHGRKQKPGTVDALSAAVGAVKGELLPEFVLRPFISPSLKVPLDQIKKSGGEREDLVLIDDDTPANVRKAILGYCKELGCKAIVVEGFARDELPKLFDRAKIVIDWCLIGSERMPIEASLHGALVVTSKCLCGQDYRDFPIPPRNVIDSKEGNGDQIRIDGTETGNALKAVLERLLKNYDQEFEDYAQLRELYSNLDLKTLTWEVKSFYFSVRDDYPKNVKFMGVYFYYWQLFLIVTAIVVAIAVIAYFVLFKLGYKQNAQQLLLKLLRRAKSLEDAK